MDVNRESSEEREEDWFEEQNRLVQRGIDSYVAFREESRRRGLFPQALRQPVREPGGAGTGRASYARERKKVG